MNTICIFAQRTPVFCVRKYTLTNFLQRNTAIAIQFYNCIEHSTAQNCFARFSM